MTADKIQSDSKISCMKLSAFLKGNEEIPEAYTVQFMITELYNLCTWYIQHQSFCICLTHFFKGSLFWEHFLYFLKDAYFRSTFCIFY